MDTNDSPLKARLEAVLFSSDEPLRFDRLQALFEVETTVLRQALQELMVEYAQDNRGVVLQEVAGGFQIRTRAEYAAWILKLNKSRVTRLSKAATESLAIIAYRQPVTRAEIEYLRGVDSGGVVRMLMEKQLVKIVGKKDVPGRPLLYGTSRHFLEFFGLKDLSELPNLQEFADPEDGALSLEMDFDGHGNS
ncbi:SMC-Scp complex subunit ScpB [Desulfuromonas acetoxidans]|uniref:Transcriptional regulator n=1 Tax=Desulfuromonas acetoxidans (strain DSM 684 / 11070) TaxID=281689 RepID=Q1JVP3_DESA6|nr:SMC-Scp complex subunit ScpB [Desulfuromonas acetoxidans]EAT14306.1 putative transcriptional regulator [Desulfuromonas acetoxidans DSM 684]MBF0645072.1 SMC-Scp complex subunit ScpB [Desulfuromonas acetoxidans]NVD23119.1 SMC-Scp complex subunit ScpB [Desulfuromonas acetoxidans]NVE15640.1 SMC-Scp complex subunit ScpB [Desulfuromonas acetoxidans]